MAPPLECRRHREASTFPVTQSSPASGDACAPGQIVADTGFIYACTASGAWKRAALTGGY